MARGELPRLDLGFHGLRQGEQAERIGHRGTALADPLGGLLLREPVLVDQVPVCFRLLERAQVLALEVLDQGQLEALRGSGLPYHDRHPVEAGPLCRSQASLTGDQLVPIPRSADDQGLQEAVAPDRVGERGERLLVEMTPGLVGIRHDVLYRDQPFTRRRGCRRRGREERFKALAQGLPHAEPPFVYLTGLQARGPGRGTPMHPATRDRRAAPAAHGSGSQTAGRCAG